MNRKSMRFILFGRPYQFTCYFFFSFVEVVQNTTIEERVALLEIQVSDLDEDVDFLFDEQVIQDEKLLDLEQETDVINSQLFLMDDAFEIIDDELESKYLSPRSIIYYYLGDYAVSTINTPKYYVQQGQ